MIKVALLLDSKNNWISEYIPREFFSNSNFVINQFYDYKEIIDYEIVFVLSYTRILKDDFISKNKFIFIVHGSDLPKGKGFAPIQWQILEGKNKIKVSLIEIDKNFDCGDIVDQMDLVFEGHELYDEIREKQAEITFELISRFLEKYPAIKKVKQTGESSYYRRRNPSDSKLDHNKTIKELFPLLRIGNNEEWPSFFELNGIKYILKIYKDQN